MPGKHILRRKEQLTILFVIGSLELGGAEKQMALLIKHLVVRGVTCHLFVLEGIGGPLYGILKEINLKIYEGGYNRRMSLFRKAPSLFRAQIRLSQVISAIRPNVVHAYLPLTNIMSSLAGRMSGIPLVITSRRALGTHQDRYRGWRIFDILSFRLSHVVTANSQAVAEDALKRELGDASKISVIYNGIDTFPFESAKSRRDAVRNVLKIPLDEKVVMSIANFIPYKGLLELIEAAAMVIRRMSDVTFILIGEDRGMLEQLKKKACFLGISDGVVFLGQRLDVPELLAAADILALSSHEEGFSNVILEAMASGLPMVATDVGGNKEAVIDGVTGWLVPPKNPTAMADRIVDLLSDKERAVRWGKRGQDRVKEIFTVEKMVENYEDLYRTIESGRYTRSQYQQELR
ncbi:MAG: glycosyltransferase [Deltaproteobacteria bacterium]|nr:glycosyltransferase [Deltaproteobacteria bacterium]